jgi:hypothetical protein
MRVGLMLLLVAATATGDPASRLELPPRLQYEDMAALAVREPRAELSCLVTSDKPTLGFDLRFHSDYRIELPVKVLSDAGGWLQVAMRVTPLAETDSSAYLAHRFRTSGAPLDSKGEVILTGGFDHGPGRFRVDWIMRDARQRVCTSHWELEAKAGIGKQDVPLTLGPNQIFDVDRSSLSNGSPNGRAPVQPLRIKLLVNLSPANPPDGLLRLGDAAVLLSIVHSIADQPGIAVSGLVACNLWDQKILHRQESVDQIDFRALERAIQSPTAGTIDIRLLRDPQSETHFVTKLLTDQLGAQTDPPDAIVIVGAKVSLKRKIPLDSLRAKGSAMCPVFYFNYNSNPTDPWTDTIGAALKAYKGATTYNIVFPRDLGVAMKELLARTVKSPKPKSVDSTV